MDEKEITNTILKLSNSAPLVFDMIGQYTDSIFGQLVQYKTDIIRHVIETIENRPSTDNDWRQLIITQQVNNEASMIKKEETYYKQKHVGTLSFRMEKFTAFFDFTPA